jgi:hypothetical protein
MVHHIIMPMRVSAKPPLLVSCQASLADAHIAPCSITSSLTASSGWLKKTKKNLNIVWYRQDGPQSSTSAQKIPLAAQQEQLALLLWWLYGGVVLTVLRTFFYVTDSQPLKWATVYFRNPTWRCMEAEAIRNLTSTMLQVKALPFVSDKDLQEDACLEIVRSRLLNSMHGSAMP